MKKIIRYRVLTVVLMLLPVLLATAQSSLPAPAIWFPFETDASHSYTDAHYRPDSLISVNISPTLTKDRFGNVNKAISFWGQENRQNSFIVVPKDHPTQPELVKLFGYSDNSTDLPDSITISVWVYVDATDMTFTRKIFFSDLDNSRFALLHKGADIFLRRIAYNASTSSTAYFDYFFGAPAAFDAGTGWYQVILVMAKRRVDAAKYVKLYVGKPARVKYDSDGPRTVTTTNDPLASNFGGTYAFTGVQDFMNTSVEEWGFGNEDNNDPVYGTNIAPVQRMDDFAVWDTVLSEMDAHALFVCQSASPADQCWRTAEMESIAPHKNTLSLNVTGEKAVTDIRVFPNPTTGELWVGIPSSRSGGIVTCTLMDVNGKTVLVRRTPVDKGGQTIRLDDIKSRTVISGLYILKVTMPGLNKTFKVLVQ